MAEAWDVLVIDDEPVVRDSVQRVLAEEGFRVATVRDAASALAHPALATCRLVLCELMLPDRSGTDVLSALHTRRPDLPVVVITGYATGENAERAKAAGAMECLPKPFEVSELLAAVHRALQDREGAREGGLS